MISSACLPISVSAPVPLSEISCGFTRVFSHGLMGGLINCFPNFYHLTLRD
jgi:hypothetical protein